MSKLDAPRLIRIGELLLQEHKDFFRQPSAIQSRLINCAAEIRDVPPDEISFQHTVLCQTGLPYKETAERRWEKKNGRIFLEIEAGRALHPQREEYVDLPLPYGPKARLILIYLCTMAIRHQSPVIDVERSMTAFLRQLQGREPNGPEIRKFKQQITSLAAATIRMATAVEGRSLQVNNQIVHRFDLWLERDEFTQRVLWPETVELSMDFFNTLLEHAVPLDQRAVASLQHSAMALDIYMWLAQRLWRIDSKQSVPWISLYEQFGTGYKQIRQFRKFFLDTLQDVLSQYPAAQGKVVPYGSEFSATGGGLLLERTPPPIQRPKLIAVR